MKYFIAKQKKATGFTFLQIIQWEINQVTSKRRIDFFDKTCRLKTEKGSTNIELCIFELF